MNEFFNRESETDKRRLLWGSMPEAEVILWSRLKRREDVKTLWLVVPGPPPLRWADFVTGFAGTTPPGPPFTRGGKPRAYCPLRKAPPPLPPLVKGGQGGWTGSAESPGRVEGRQGGWTGSAESPGGVEGSPVGWTGSAESSLGVEGRQGVR